MPGRYSSVIVMLALLTFHSVAISSLRYGSDLQTNDVQVKYDVPTNRYQMVLSNSFDYIYSTFILCFRERPFAPSPNFATCSLVGSSSTYECIEYVGSTSPASYNYFQLSSDLTTISGEQVYTPANVASGAGINSISISLTGTLADNTSKTYLPTPSSYYEVVSNRDRTFVGGDQVTIRYNYATTGFQTLKQSTNNVLMPHNFLCYIDGTNFVTALFYSGYLRFSERIMIFSVVSFSLNNMTFAGWTGISFSSSHAFRDMMGFILNDGTLYDLYSLIASAPFDDTSSNIGGINDYTLMDSSGKNDLGAINNFYYNQFYRLYETQSTGDENILNKIEQQYCVASYFEMGVLFFNGAPSDSNYMHQYLHCFTPNIDLGDTFLWVTISLVLFWLL